MDLLEFFLHEGADFSSFIEEFEGPVVKLLIRGVRGSEELRAMRNSDFCSRIWERFGSCWMGACSRRSKTCSKR